MERKGGVGEGFPGDVFTIDLKTELVVPVSFSTLKRVLNIRVHCICAFLTYSWTWGYDFYTPPRVVVGHRYNRSRKGHWAMSDGTETARLASRRMQLLMHLPLTSGVR